MQLGINKSQVWLTMEKHRQQQHRKTFDEKQNDHKHLNKKPSMLSSINYKSTHLQNPIKILPNLPPFQNTNNMHYFESVQPSRLSLPLTSRPSDLTRPSLLPSEPISNSHAYCKVYHCELAQYFKQILNFESGPFLTGHQITSSLRARMLDWMVEVTQSYKFSPKTYFAGVQIMDRYFAKQLAAIPVQKLHIIGVVSMLIASKMEEVFPFRLKTIYQKIVHKKISIKELAQVESVIFQKLDFNTITTTFFDKIMLQLLASTVGASSTLMLQEVIGHTLKDQKTLEEVQSYCAYISKYACYNYELMTSFSKQTIADAIVITVFQVLQLSIPSNAVSDANQPQLGHCKAMLQETIKDFKKVHKGLGNLFKFSNQSIIERVEKSFY